MIDRLNDKRYLLDGAPVSANELIAKARPLNDEYEADYQAGFTHSVSGAATILRWHGYTVDRSPELNAVSR